MALQVSTLRLWCGWKMPRPGPRPYECRRRAWHSDRHQPVRGSIIQHIFRVVHENHASATKKNKEWQAKLPIVVLRAEEIMYSKANTEAEYVDLDTLWDRLNDAVDTIIRRDESTEAGKLLPPCVEAALNLGCIPVRALRSERYANLRSYLCPRSQEPTCVSTNRLKPNSGHSTSSTTPHYENQPNLGTPAAVSSARSVSKSDKHVLQNNSRAVSCSFPLLNAKFLLPGDSLFNSRENSVSFKAGSVYPLYYGTDFQPDMAHFGCQTQKISDTIVVGTPILPLMPEPAQVDFLQNLLAQDRDGQTPNGATRADVGDDFEKAPDVEHDLSLRLGQFSAPCAKV